MVHQGIIVASFFKTVLFSSMGTDSTVTTTSINIASCLLTSFICVSPSMDWYVAIRTHLDLWTWTLWILFYFFFCNIVYTHSPICIVCAGVIHVLMSCLLSQHAVKNAVQLSNYYYNQVESMGLAELLSLSTSSFLNV